MSHRQAGGFEDRKVGAQQPIPAAAQNHVPVQTCGVHVLGTMSASDQPSTTSTQLGTLQQVAAAAVTTLHVCIDAQQGEHKSSSKHS